MTVIILIISFLNCSNSDNVTTLIDLTLVALSLSLMKSLLFYLICASNCVIFMSYSAVLDESVYFSSYLSPFCLSISNLSCFISSCASFSGINLIASLSFNIFYSLGLLWAVVALLCAVVALAAELLCLLSLLKDGNKDYSRCTLSSILVVSSLVLALLELPVMIIYLSVLANSVLSCPFFFSSAAMMQMHLYRLLLMMTSSLFSYSIFLISAILCGRGWACKFLNSLLSCNWTWSLPLRIIIECYNLIGRHITLITSATQQHSNSIVYVDNPECNQMVGLLGLYQPNLSWLLVSVGCSTSIVVTLSFYVMEFEVPRGLSTWTGRRYYMPRTVICTARSFQWRPPRTFWSRTSIAIWRSARTWLGCRPTPGWQAPLCRGVPRCSVEWSLLAPIELPPGSLSWSQRTRPCWCRSCKECTLPILCSTRWRWDARASLSAGRVQYAAHSCRQYKLCYADYISEQVLDFVDIPSDDSAMAHPDVVTHHDVAH